MTRHSTCIEEREEEEREKKIHNVTTYNIVTLGEEEKESGRDGEKMALQNGLIDKIGSFTEVENYLRDVIKQEPVICWQ